MSNYTGFVRISFTFDMKSYFMSKSNCVEPGALDVIFEIKTINHTTLEIKGQFLSEAVIPHKVNARFIHIS